MTPPPRTARVRVCASTSNLGPGFDALGLALDLPLEVSARAAPGRDEHRLGQLSGHAQDWPRDDSNLLLRAFDRARRALGGAGAFEFDVHSEIPTERGLGSSGAAVAAGLLLARALAPEPAQMDALLGWGLELEGHPDNVAPALLGGCVLCQPRAGAAPRVVPLELSDSLGFAVAWPDATLETAFARAILPAEVSLEQAAEGARRLALVVEGLRRGAGELLEAGNEEALHVPHRLPHVPAGAAVLDAARAAGAHLATLSGSGTALFAVAPRAAAGRVAEAMGAAFAAAGAGGGARAFESAGGPGEVELLED